MFLSEKAANGAGIRNLGGATTGLRHNLSFPAIQGRIVGGGGIEIGVNHEVPRRSVSNQIKQPKSPRERQDYKLQEPVKIRRDMHLQFQLSPQ